MSQKELTCPRCGCHKIAKNGTEKTPSGRIQKYVCCICARRFTELSLVPKAPKPVKLVKPSKLFLRVTPLNSVKCPRCGGQRVWRDGCYYPPFEDFVVQRYYCRDCSRRFSKRKEPGVS